MSSKDKGNLGKHLNCPVCKICCDVCCSASSYWPWGMNLVRDILQPVWWWGLSPCDITCKKYLGRFSYVYTVFFNYFHIVINSFRYFISDKSPGVLLSSVMSKTTTSADLSVKHFLRALSHAEDQCQSTSSSLANLIDFVCGHGEPSTVPSPSPARVRQKPLPQVKCCQLHGSVWPLCWRLNITSRRRKNEYLFTPLLPSCTAQLV